PFGGGADTRVPGFLSPFDRRRSLLGSSCARWGGSAFLTVGLPAIITPDPNGVVMLRMNKIRPGRAPPLPRGRWCAPGRRLSSGRHPPLPSGQSLRPRCHIPSAGVTFTRRHQGFTRVRPSPRDGWRPPRSRKAKPLPAGLLLARDHRMERRPLRLRPRASHPAVTRRARRGGDRPFAHWPGYYTYGISRTSTVPPTFNSCTLMSHVIAGGLHHRAGDALGNQMLTQCQDLAGHRAPGRDRLHG